MQMHNQCYTFVAEEPPVLVDWLPWHHTAGGNVVFGLALTNGGTLYIDHGKPTDSGIRETLRNLREVSPTLYFTVPKGLESLAHAMQDDSVLRDSFFRRLRLIFPAGAALPRNVQDAVQSLAVQSVGQRIAMTTGLGMTETAPFAVCASREDVKSGHIGLPAPGIELKLVPMDGKTELRYRGPNVTPGYWRAPEQTAEAFDAEGFYCSGDAVKPLDPAHPEHGFAFDGRTAEDFKLSTGTFVSVGPLRARVIGAGDPCVQDVVVAGMNRDEIGLLIFPRLDACRALAGLPNGTPTLDVLGAPAVRGFFQTLVDGLYRGGTGSATRVARASVLADPPSIDRGEVTDKGSINQRAVLLHREALVEHLYAGGDGVILPRR
jgi:feruloyl-CoA synthase